MRTDNGAMRTAGEWAAMCGTAPLIDIIAAAQAEALAAGRRQGLEDAKLAVRGVGGTHWTQNHWTRTDRALEAIRTLAAAGGE